MPSVCARTDIISVGLSQNAGEDKDKEQGGTNKGTGGAIDSEYPLLFCLNAPLYTLRRNGALIPLKLNHKS